MKSASRRTGMYFHSLPKSSSPSIVRAPQLTMPVAGTCAAQLMPRGLSTPFSPSEKTSSSPAMPRRSASVPAGAFQTPRVPSMRAIRPAIAPLAPTALRSPLSLMSSRG